MAAASPHAERGDETEPEGSLVGGAAVPCSMASSPQATPRTDRAMTRGVRRGRKCRGRMMYQTMPRAGRFPGIDQTLQSPHVRAMHEQH